MKKTISMTYPADPQRVATMLSDSDYQRGRIDRFGLEDATVDVAARGQGFVATIAAVSYTHLTLPTTPYV